MLRVNGFYGHVKRNDLRSAAMFAGFLVAFQLVAAVALFLPLFFLDPLHAPFVFGFSGYLERYAPLVLAAGGAMFLVRFSRHVASVRATVAFAYVDRRTHPRLVDAVETQAIAAGLPFPKVGLIDGPARNAFACGLSARSAVVVATRGLVEALDDDELAAVVAHEIAHIKNGDIRLMAAANVLMDNLEWLRRRNPLRVAGYGRALLAVLVPPFLLLCLLAGVVTAAAFTLARVSRLLISSSREFVADAEAVRATHNPAALISALRRIEGRSAVEGIGPQADAMMIDGAVEGAFASHPPIAERIAVLERLSGAMAHVPLARKDTRSADQATARRGGASGREGAPGPGTAPAPARSLIGRVNAGPPRKHLGADARGPPRDVAGLRGAGRPPSLDGRALRVRPVRPPRRGHPRRVGVGAETRAPHGRRGRRADVLPAPRRHGPGLRPVLLHEGLPGRRPRAPPAASARPRARRSLRRRGGRRLVRHQAGAVSRPQVAVGAPPPAPGARTSTGRCWDT